MLLVPMFVSIGIIIVNKYIWVETEEFFRFGVETGEVLFTLATSFLAAYIFYLIDIWYPSKGKQDILKERLSNPLNKVLLNMIAPIIGILNMYSASEVKLDKIITLSKDELDKLLTTIDLYNDENPKYLFDPWRKENVLEYLFSFLTKSNKIIDQINKLPNVDFDLLILLDKIQYCDYKSVLEEQLYLYPIAKQGGTSGAVLSSGLQEYISLFKELNEYMKSNKIDITFVNIPIIEHMSK